FLSGRYYGRLGGFINATYDGVDNRWATDNVDIRLTDIRAIGDDHTLLYGATFNNAPSVQDVWNTLPSWSQLISSELAPTPPAHLGADLQHQGKSRAHVVPVRRLFICENQVLSAAREAEAATRACDVLRTEQLWASYYSYAGAGITRSLSDVAAPRGPLLYA